MLRIFIIILSVIAFLILLFILDVCIIVPRINTNATIQRAEKDDYESQIHLADWYSTGEAYQRSGLMINKEKDKADYWKARAASNPSSPGKSIRMRHSNSN